MRISFDSDVEVAAAPGFLDGLAAALAPESFAEACCLRTYAGSELLLKCPETPRKIIADSATQETWHYQWIRDELLSSVIDGRRRKAQGLPPDGNL